MESDTWRCSLVTARRWKQAWRCQSGRNRGITLCRRDEISRFRKPTCERTEEAWVSVSNASGSKAAP